MLFKSPIPAEIFEEIVSYLHDDEAALKQCALVSSWTLPSCQRHLFKTIDLKFVSARIYDQFTQVFTNRPHLSNYVRSLELDIRAPSKHDSLRFKFKKALPEDDDSFHCVLRSFTSLSKIWLNIAIPRGQSIHFKLTQVVHHLLSLHTLHTVTFECGWLPTSFLDQFTHIRNLNLFNLSVEDAVPSADEKLPPSRIASPTSLILLNPNEDFLGPLAKFASHPNTSLDFSLLQYIAVQDQDPDDSPLPHARLADIIRMSSKSLKHFSWFSFSTYTSLQFLENLDLPSIVKISISLRELDPAHFNEQLNAIRLFFSKIRGPTSSFEVSLTFSCRHWDYDLWNLPEWEPLGHCLSKAGAVASFTFNLRGLDCYSSDKELVMENIVVQLTQRLAPLANENALGIFIFWLRSVKLILESVTTYYPTFTDDCGNHGGVLTRVG